MSRSVHVDGEAVGSRLGIHEVLSSIEGSEGLDAVDRSVGRWAGRLGDGRRGELLRGKWLGHALHPALTDVPIGCWTSAWLLDMVGGRRARPAAQRLIGIGLLAVVPTALTGAADWSAIADKPRRRVGLAHALSNTVATALFTMSWRSRRRGHYAAGVTWGMFAAAAATVGGHLGGHLAFGQPASESTPAETAPAETAPTEPPTAPS